MSAQLGPFSQQKCLQSFAAKSPRGGNAASQEVSVPCHTFFRYLAACMFHECQSKAQQVWLPSTAKKLSASYTLKKVH